VCSPLAHQILPLIPTVRACDERGALQRMEQYNMGSRQRRLPRAHSPPAPSQIRTRAAASTMPVTNAVAQTNSRKLFRIWSSQPPAYTWPPHMQAAVNRHDANTSNPAQNAPRSVWFRTKKPHALGEELRNDVRFALRFKVGRKQQSLTDTERDMVAAGAARCEKRRGAEKAARNETERRGAKQKQSQDPPYIGSVDFGLYFGGNFVGGLLQNFGDNSSEHF
jgi:hypothetical protein